MKKKGCYIILSLVFMFACNDSKIERPKKPSNLIKKDKMVQVLYDMAIITAAKGSHKRTIEDKGIVPEQLIFKKHEIDSMQFVLSNEYYSYDIDTYEEIYEEVRIKLSNERIIQDSLAKQERDKKRTSASDRKKKMDSISKPNSKPLRPLKKVDTLQ
ncbi:DUF4296 domain-containing protein [Flavobacteriaceae sp. LMIT009]